jgi:hypothetical protein
VADGFGLETIAAVATSGEAPSCDSVAAELGHLWLLNG